MYIVNAGPGFKKMLWPAAQKFLDVKTIAKIQVKVIALTVWPCNISISSFSFEYCTDYLNIQVLEPKSLYKLLEVIDSRYVYHILCTILFAVPVISLLHISPFSQLPEFLGGSCTCAAEGGCLRSSKGPWNDIEIMKVFLILPVFKMHFFFACFRYEYIHSTVS